MTDRDTFAAAALTGLLCNGDYNMEAIPCRAFTVADAMLRERGNQPEPPDSSPVTKPMPKEKQAEVSDGSEPVAWMVTDPSGRIEACRESFAEAAQLATDFTATEDGDVVYKVFAVYSQPQPTLTDAEREAVGRAADWLDRWQQTHGYHSAESGDLATLRGLLERL